MRILRAAVLCPVEWEWRARLAAAHQPSARGTYRRLRAIFLLLVYVGATGGLLENSKGSVRALVVLGQFLPGVLLRHDRTQIFDIGLGLVRRKLLTGDLFGFREAPL